MNVKKIYSKKVKRYNLFGKRDFARFADKLFKEGFDSAYPLADTKDKRTLAYLHRNGKVDEKTIYELMKKAQRG